MKIHSFNTVNNSLVFSGFPNNLPYVFSNVFVTYNTSMKRGSKIYSLQFLKNII